MNIPAWMVEIDFCWFAEDEKGCIATFNKSTSADMSLPFIPELVREQYTESYYIELMEVILDILPITNQPLIIQQEFRAWDSARGVYEYTYNEEKEQFRLASIPNVELKAQKLRLHSPDAFDHLVLRLNTVSYKLQECMSIQEMNHFLVHR